jgi:L-seryl-tRNA(Ser) seleniumtransferase
MAQGGVSIVDVGTTNKTRAADYERAISEQTGALLKVHPSNFVDRRFHQSNRG